MFTEENLGMKVTVEKAFIIFSFFCFVKKIVFLFALLQSPLLTSHI